MAEIPAAIGRYAVEGELGRGAMGVVYKGHDPEIDRPVAIKLVRVDLLETRFREDYLARFRREVQAAGKCLHPNIVAIYDFGSHDGHPFFVMEYVDAVPVDHTLPKDGGIGVEAAVGIVLQLLDALACAHGLGVVHRDVKPANLLLASGGRVKVMDFGISRVSTSHLTQIGAVMGTPRYMSPEQIKGDAVDARSDIFSAGAVLHELITGRTPFSGPGLEAVMAKLFYDEADIEPAGPVMPEAVRAVVVQAVAKDPAGRFPTADAMATALRQALSGGPALAAHTIAVPPPRPLVAFDPELLGAIERRLAQYLGPIAGRLVRNAAVGAPGLDTICDRLAQHIDAPAERDRFLADVRARVAQAPAAASLPLSGVSTLTAADIEKAQTDLARYIGPIAGVLVKRAATGALSATELREALAEHLEHPAEKTSFLTGT